MIKIYTYCKKFGNKILVRNHTGEIKTITKHNWNIYVEDKAGKYKTIYGKSLRKETFPTLSKASNSIKENHTINIYAAKNFGYQYIRDVFLHDDAIAPKDLYIANIDIETGRDKEGYSRPIEARCQVTSISLHNMMRDT